MVKPKMTPMITAKENFVGSAGTIGTRYSAGIQNGNPWQVNAASDAAERLYAANTSDAIAKKRRQRVCSTKSESDWRDPALNKGAAQIGNAVRLSGDKWVKGYSPYGDAIANADMAEKTSDPMQNVQGRLVPVLAAILRKKAEIKG